MRNILSIHIGVLVFWSLTACQTEQGGLATRMPLKLTSTLISSATSLPPYASQTASVRNPTITPVTTPTLQDQPSILLNEDFSQEQTCLESFDNERALGEVEAGVYVLEVHADDEVVNANCETLVVGDFILSVEVRVETYAPVGTYYFGLLFRVSGDERYAYVIGSEGGYCVYYANEQLFVPFTNSTDFPVQCWTLLPESAKADGVQRLRVVAVEDRIDLYLNGELLAVVRDRQLRDGWVGFVVATAGGGGVRVTFDNLTVERP